MATPTTTQLPSPFTSWLTAARKNLEHVQNAKSNSIDRMFFLYN